MSDEFNLVAEAIERQHSRESALTRRRMVAGAAATLGSMGVLGATGAVAKPRARASTAPMNDTQTILNIAATAEVLATIVNTIGYERVRLDPVTRRNIRAAAREEFIHYKTLIGFGGKPLTTKIWVPDAVFASRTGLLSTLEVGDQIFVNAYLVATRTFAAAGSANLALISAEFMGVEAVHRALARQSLGKLGNDRVFMKYDRKETARDAPNVGQRGFVDITVAATQLQEAGFGFGAEGNKPGRFYEFEAIRERVPGDDDLNTHTPDGD